MLVLPPELTHSQAPSCAKMLQTAAQGLRDAQIVVDASALEKFDSSALAVLLECRRD
ncbi:MAG: STAS domain-containing protein, partial [Burkholderiaceae bacterium]|nr:STAS domain-containing protein [Burkholderiaceae bacterium]